MERSAAGGPTGALIPLGPSRKGKKNGGFMSGLSGRMSFDDDFDAAVLPCLSARELTRFPGQSGGGLTSG